MNAQAAKLDLTSLFGAIDRMDVVTFESFLTEDSVFRFGNAQPVRGRSNVSEYVAGFFSSIKALKHNVLGVWEQNNVFTVQGEVTYTRKDDRSVTVPFVNLFKTDGKLIREYLVYVDASPLYS